jgi:hypothetical protein
VLLFGGDPRDPVHRRSVGVTPQETGLPGSLRVGAVALAFVGRPRLVLLDEPTTGRQSLNSARSTAKSVPSPPVNTR